MKKKNLSSQFTPSDLSTPGLRIRASRIEANLSIRELAALTGLTPEAISFMENGVHPPSLKSLKEISVCLNRPVHYLGCFETLPEDTFGDRLNKARLYHGLTKQEAALQLGVDPKSILNWESNGVLPSVRNQKKINCFLGILGR